MEAAIKLGDKMKKLAMYEAPYNSDEAARQAWKDFRKHIKEALAAGRRGDAIGVFLTLLGMTADQLDGILQHPMWPSSEAISPTKARDAPLLCEETSPPTGL